MSEYIIKKWLEQRIKVQEKHINYVNELFKEGNSEYYQKLIYRAEIELKLIESLILEVTPTED